MAEHAQPLRHLIEAEIRASGPLSVSRYMQLCLLHPEHGYYVTGDPVGAGGDFITAPEISQMFGEMIGVWVAGQWHRLGGPRQWQLAELGPGRGTLMRDVQRVLQKAAPPPILTLLESNHQLRRTQADVLDAHDPQWLEGIGEIDTSGPPLIVIANEFFDALPIRQLQKADTAWHERQIGLKGNTLTFGLSSVPLPETTVPDKLRLSADGAIWETSPAGLDMMSHLARCVALRGGALLVLDYGHTETGTGDTLQAVKDHRYADPLADPGEADLTAHVDFEALADAARLSGAAPLPVTTQGQFLADHGINERATALKSANPDRTGEIDAALERLTGADQMGDLFKVLQIVDRND